MKMAKPSKKDEDAAGDLMALLDAIDGRFGGPFSNDEAGDDLFALLEKDESSFDPEDRIHLITLYNHLAQLLRSAPSFHGRVIGGMCYVIMNEANQIIDPNADVIDLHPRFNQMQERITQLEGLLPDMPPRPPEGEGLPRYGLRWNGPTEPLSVPMHDGYWTPWHLADAVRAERDAVLASADRMRKALLAAKSWLDGWASADFEIGLIEEALGDQNCGACCDGCKGKLCRLKEESPPDSPWRPMLDAKQAKVKP